MTNVERVAELLSSADGQNTFIGWAENEVTQLMLSAAREIALPSEPTSTDPGAVGISLGKTIGATNVVNYLANPIRLPETQEMPSEYGASDILQGDGYGDEG